MQKHCTLVLLLLLAFYSYSQNTAINDGTIKGSGTINGSVINNGTINPGDNGIGKITINGDLTLNDNSKLVFDLKDDKFDFIEIQNSLVVNNFNNEKKIIINIDVGFTNFSNPIKIIKSKNISNDLNKDLLIEIKYINRGSYLFFTNITEDSIELIPRSNPLCSTGLDTSPLEFESINSTEKTFSMGFGSFDDDLPDWINWGEIGLKANDNNTGIPRTYVFSVTCGASTDRKLIFQGATNCKNLGLDCNFYAINKIISLSPYLTSFKYSNLNFSGVESAILPISTAKMRNVFHNWKGFITFPQTGKYILNLRNDDHSKLIFNNQQVHYDTLSVNTTDHKFEVNVLANEKYPIDISYLQKLGNYEVKFEWELPTGVKEVVPTCQLHPFIKTQENFFSKSGVINTFKASDHMGSTSQVVVVKTNQALSFTNPDWANVEVINKLTHYELKVSPKTSNDTNLPKTGNLVINGSEALSLRQEALCVLASNAMRETQSTGIWTDTNLWPCGQLPTIFTPVKIKTNHIVTIPSNTIIEIKDIELQGKVILNENSKLILKKN